MEGIQYIYFEKVFGLNLVLNWLILWVTAKFSRLETSNWRITGGASLGALYSFSMLMPQWSILWTMAAKITLSLAMVAVVFAPLPWRRFGKGVGYFYLSSFALGGAVYGFIFLAAGNKNILELVSSLSSISQFLPMGLLTAVVGKVVLGKWGSAIHKQKHIQAFFRVSLEIEVAGQSCQVQALIDTGNGLRDPISRNPVIITEAGVLANLLPPEIQEAGSMLMEAGEIGFEDLPTQWVSRIRLIPYSAVGTKGGLLLAFRPDSIKVIYGAGSVQTSKAVVGIFPGELSSDGSFGALLHPDILEKTLNI